MSNVSISNPTLNTVRTINATIPIGYKAEVNVFKNSTIPSFYMLGNGNENKKMNKIQNRNVKSFWKEAMRMSPQEQWFMLLLEPHFENNLEPQEVKQPNNIYKLSTTCKVFCPSSNLTNSQKQKLYKAYKRLRAKDIIRRIKREHYMFNPMLLIPTDFNEEYTFYYSLK